MASGARPKTSSQAQPSALDSSKQTSFSFSKGDKSVQRNMAADGNKATRIYCNSTMRRAMECLGVFEYLRSAFRFDLSFEGSDVCFICETKQDLDNLCKEYTVYSMRIKIIDISDIFPPETWKLFIADNDRQTEYLREMLKGVTQKYKFLLEGSRLSLYCIGVATEDHIIEKLKECLYCVTIPYDVSHLPMVQQYLHEYMEDVCICGSVSHPNMKSIYCMRYLKEKIHVLKITDDSLPVEAWNLVLNDNPNRDAELEIHIDCKSDIKFFVHELDGLCMLCISESNDDDIIEAFRRLICSCCISHEMVDYPTVQHFLNDNKNDISVCKDLTNPYFTRLYYFSHIKESMAEKILQLGCRCDNFTKKYLETSGASLLTHLENKFKVKASLFEMYIEVEGSEGLAFMEELKVQLITGVHHSTCTDECKRLMSSKQLKEKLSNIAADNGCCVQFVPFQPFENTYVCKGLTYMSTWYLTHSSNFISLVSGDMKNTGLDAIIVFVNSSWYGEDPADTEGRLIPFTQFRKGNLRDILPGENFGGIECQNMLAVVVSAIKLDNMSVEKRITLCGKDLQDTMLFCYTNLAGKKLKNVGILLPTHSDEFRMNVIDILKPCKEYQQLEMHFHVCVTSHIEHLCQLINTNLKNDCERRITYPDIHGIFSIRNDFEANISPKSLLNIQAECIVVPVDKTLDLNKGILVKLVLKEAGSQLQGELIKNYKTPLEHESIVPARPGHLSNKGVKLILFVVIPHWTRCNKNIAVMEHLVNMCLLKADRYYCKSIAFPLLGIGNLGYPIRDVVSATLDGIDRYKRESVLQNVSKVTISAPSFANEPSHQMLYNEVLNERLDLEKERKEKSVSLKEITYLYVDDQNVKISVINERDRIHLLEGHYIDVKLCYNPGQRLYHPCLKNATLIVNCEKTKEGIQQAMDQVVKFCEENRITSFALLTCKDIRMSEYDQVKAITSAVMNYIQSLPVNNYPTRLYKYLSKMAVLVGDNFVMDHPSMNELSDKKPWTSFFSSNTPVVFTRKTVNTARYYVNTVIIGSSEKQVKDTRDKIVEAIHSFKESNKDDYPGHDAERVCDITDHEDSDEFHSCKEEEDYLVDKTILGNSKNAADDHKIDDNMDEVSTSENADRNVPDPDFQLLIEDSVQASLNPGIMDFLKDSHLESGYYEKWVKWIEAKFNVVFLNNDEEPQVKGSLTDIIEFEKYLDTSFPELPLHCTSDDISEPIPIVENHFVCPSNTTVRVNMSSKVASVIEGMVLEKVQSAFKKNPIFNLKKDKNGLVLTCSVTMARIVEDFVKSVKCEVENIDKQSSKFPFDVTECILRYNDITIKVLHDDISKSSTDCIVSPVNTRMNTTFGAAHSIAKCAGNDYVRELKSIVKTRGDMKQNECRTTKAGNLKCKNVIHVQCVSSQLKNVDAEALQTYREALENCFREASKHTFTSIALPMLGTGMNGLSLDHCAVESFRALSNLKSSPLKEVRFYNKDPKHVTEFSDNLLNCFDGQGTGNFEFMCFQHKHRYIYIVDKLKSHCDYSVDTVYVEVEGTIPATPANYGKVKVKTEKTSGCTAVKVLVPEWQQDTFLFEQSVSSTTSELLHEANRLHIKYLGITTFEDRVNGNDQHAELIGETLMKSVIEYFQQKGNKIEVIYLMSSDQSVLKKMCSVIMKANK